MSDVKQFILRDAKPKMQYFPLNWLPVRFLGDKTVPEILQMELPARISDKQNYIIKQDKNILEIETKRIAVRPHIQTYPYTYLSHTYTVFLRTNFCGKSLPFSFLFPKQKYANKIYSTMTTEF